MCTGKVERLLRRRKDWQHKLRELFMNDKQTEFVSSCDVTLSASSWLAGTLVGWLTGWLVRWLTGWLLGWRAGGLVGWLAG